MSSSDALVSDRLAIQNVPQGNKPVQAEFDLGLKKDSLIEIDPALKSKLTEAIRSSKNTGGGFVDYYLQEVKHPQRGGAAYTAECDDLIEALGLNFDEGEIFKEIWRTAKQRQGTGKPGNTLLRGREKIFHRASRLLKAAKHLI